jgi:hypothetical protein
MQDGDLAVELEAIRQLPLEKRYVWRVASALKWGFADFDDLGVEADKRTLTPEDFAKVMDLLNPKTSVGNGQGIGNSGVELMTRYEIQMLESNEHLTYADGGVGAIYGVWPPLVNPSRPMGEWNVYDIFFESPRFDGDKLVKPAYITLLFNGVLAQNHKDFLGTTIWRRLGTYTAHPAEQPLSLQDHSQPVRFRNIWVRKINPSNAQ